MDPAASPLTAAEQRVSDAMVAHGLPGEIRVLDQLATTAPMAAQALGVALGQIVKSLVFLDRDRGAPLMMLVSGANRVHERRAGRQIGVTLARADADTVRTATGFAIGGVSPLAHPGPLPVYLDRDLLAFETVWAAAGHARSVFAVSPEDLVRATGARTICVT